ncbi:MAG TPA: DUF4082 domain-containing protein [Bryobacteraceae bacterium]|jgi:hypothetical protein|nr:DUF4082 domain-containing protein [Bryobacteraceae bacterium]
MSLLAATPARASFWNSSTVPATPNSGDSSAVTLGLEFQSSAAGTVTAVRFYKGQYDTGTHSGQLWSASGTLLGSVTFGSETASGWQQANFSKPISIQANTTYVISYFAPNGNYADDTYYNWGGLNAAPLKVVGSAPGVYAYGSGAAFPNQSWDASNYYVDLVFIPQGSSQTYSISGTVSGATASISLSGASSASTETNSSGQYTFSGLANGSYLLSPSASGYSFSPATSSVTVNGANVTGVNFTATKNTSHSVTLSWTASTSPNISGYKVYRAGVSGGPYALVSGSLVSGTSYVDSNVVAGDTYYYVTTAVNSSGLESAYSNQASAVVP